MRIFISTLFSLYQIRIPFEVTAGIKKYYLKLGKSKNDKILAPLQIFLLGKKNRPFNLFFYVYA